MCVRPLHVQVGLSETETRLEEGNPINLSPVLQSKNYVFILAILAMNSAGFIVLQQPSASPEGLAVPCRTETVLKNIIILKKDKEQQKTTK